MNILQQMFKSSTCNPMQRHHSQLMWVMHAHQTSMDSATNFIMAFITTVTRWNTFSSNFKVYGYHDHTNISYKTYLVWQDVTIFIKIKAVSHNSLSYAYTTLMTKHIGAYLLSSLVHKPFWKWNVGIVYFGWCSGYRLEQLTIMMIKVVYG